MRSQDKKLKLVSPKGFTAGVDDSSCSSVAGFNIYVRSPRSYFPTIDGSGDRVHSNPCTRNGAVCCGQRA